MKTKLLTLASICLCIFNTAHPQYISSTYTDVSAPYLNQGTMNNPIVRLAVEIGAVSVPVNSLTFVHNCTTNPANDIESANVYYTGNNSAFSTLTSYGNQWYMFPAASFAFSSVQSLLPGYNYFWLTYNIRASALCNDYAGGDCVGIFVNAVSYTPVLVGSPACPVICGTTGLNEHASQTEVSISPNPATDKIYISFPATTSESITIKIYSITGEIVLEEENKSKAPVSSEGHEGLLWRVHSDNFQFPVSNFQNGIYFLSVQSEKEKFIRKIAVQH